MDQKFKIPINFLLFSSVKKTGKVSINEKDLLMLIVLPRQTSSFYQFFFSEIEILSFFCLENNMCCKKNSDRV